MSAMHPVPADSEPMSIIDLADDCREVSGVLAPFVMGEIRLPEPRSTVDLTIDDAVAAQWSDWA